MSGKSFVKEVNTYNFADYTDEQLRQEFDNIKENFIPNKHTLAKVYAIVRETSKRTLGLRHFDVQILGGYVLNDGAVAEMSTGAGKTLTATLPLVYNSLSGKGAHLVTVNDYLAKRDCEWMGPIYEFLGLTYGYIIHDTPKEERKELYERDILYITNSELGFDYLRDNMAKRLEQRVCRGYFNYAIIDEVDSILIDESRTPLIISMQGGESNDIYKTCDLFVKSLSEKDVEKDEDTRVWTLTEKGVKKAEKVFGIKNYSDAEHTTLRHHITQAIKANYDMKLDKQYIIKDGEIIIIDEHTGRMAEGRRYNDGLHQAIEAKENVEIKNESITLASITYQNFFKQYEKFSGMTGTAMTEKKEFKEIYGLKVVRIPDNKPCIRIDNPDLIYVSEKAKLNAVIKDIKENYSRKRPVLIGTLDIEKSEQLAKMLDKEGIPYNLLNAKQNEQEANIVSQAGNMGAVTIATNMAGRGTDIKLGKGVKELGGLKIIASERAVDRRIDNQLVGRSGRQGDPGESQFYLSLDDELMEYAAGSSRERIANLDKDNPDPIDAKIFTKLIYSCQKKIENRHFETRKNTTKYDKILNNQRIHVYDERDYVLKNDCSSLVLNMIPLVLNTEYNKNPVPMQLDYIRGLFNLNSVSLGALIEEAETKMNTYIQSLENTSYLSEVILYVVDAYWVKHMEDMQILRQDVKGAIYRNEDPVHVFNKKATQLFEEMNYSIKRDIIRNILIAF